MANETVRERILSAFATAGRPLTAVEVAERVPESTYDNVRGEVLALHGEGQLRRISRGVYQLDTEPLAINMVRETQGTSNPQLQGSRDAIYDVVASAGPGGFVISEEPIGYLTGTDALSRPGRRVVWIAVRGDSMGELYRKGMLVPVHLFDGGPRDISEDDVYLFRLESSIQIKRLQRLPGNRLRVISDNPRYAPVDIEIHDSIDFAILGRVIT